MAEQKKLVIVNSRGFDDERSSVAWSIANTAAASDMDVTMFLVAAGVDWVRKGAADVARLNPLDPTMSDMIGSFLANGGRILVCPPCAKVRRGIVDRGRDARGRPRNARRDQRRRRGTLILSRFEPGRGVLARHRCRAPVIENRTVFWTTAATSTDIHNTPVGNCDTPETRGATALSCRRNSS
jgi:predicted peroxiredoxin